jgi:FkbM family methyltransferase
MIVDKLLTPFLRLPHFKGKTRIETAMRHIFWAPNQTKVFGNLRMELDPAEWTQMQLLKRNWLEPLTLALYKKLLRPGDVFVDVGAHVGFHTLVARQFVGRGGLVIAIEPQPYNAQKILANWHANNFTNLKLVIGAAGPNDDWVELHDQSITDRTLLTLRERGGKNEAQRFEVPLVSLDGVLQRHKIDKVKLLKVDVEGYESEVFAGVGEKLSVIENVIVEILPNAQTVELVAKLFGDRGFGLRTVEDREWHPGELLPENNLWAGRGS